MLDHFGVFAPLPPATRLSHTTQLCHTPSFTHNFHTQLCQPPPLTHHLSHTTLSHTIFPPPSPLSFLPSPSPLQHVLLIIGRSWLVGFSGPLIFKVFALWFGTCNLKSSNSAVSSCQEICRYGRFLKLEISKSVWVPESYPSRNGASNWRHQRVPMKQKLTFQSIRHKS